MTYFNNLSLNSLHYRTFSNAMEFSVKQIIYRVAIPYYLHLKDKKKTGLKGLILQGQVTEKDLRIADS